MILRLWVTGALLLGVQAPAVEPWADPSLPVASGLELWLDAARLKLRDGEEVRAWPDASGRKRNLSAPAPEAAPRFASEKGASAVRFDGRDDRLGASRAGLRLREFTLVLVAAVRSDAGGYRALASGSAADRNDYVSGFNLDLGSRGNGALNAEGAGFGGERNLLKRSLNPGAFRRVILSARPGPSGVRLHVDGALEGARDREEGAVLIDEFRLGARRYDNASGVPFDSGFLHGDVAEALLFSRVLKDDEREAIDAWLAKKHEAALAGKALGVEPALPVTMTVPGFTVKRLPVTLTNINNVDYAADGRLIALGYDGRIHVLRDTDGDGLEDEVKPYWYEGEGDFRGPIGMVVAPEGIYVASKGKVSLIRDRDGDGKGDACEVVATGWPEILQAVDTVGLALDKDGSLYFGLGCANFANAFLLDKEGKAHYDIRNERGTIQKLSPDRKSRETVCTGVRFTVALAFNRHGDLFCTDQEGETWMPNGNPLDELLHIRPGRNYGFPPPHPRHNPEAVDEGAVVTFGPQHQSTCGLKFNEAGPGRASFGPSFWEGDALVAGESRGKIWRAPLVKTPAGYVGRHALIASLSMLLIDVAVSPKGDLVATCHSGPPDWGTGPKGEGRLFKIVHSDRAAPQPVGAWAAGPLEVRVAFDAPVDPATVEKAEIVFGEYVSAGDRLEVLHPPYKVLEEQKRAPRVALKVTGRKLSDDGRTLTLATAPHPWMATYALTLSGSKGSPIDLAYDLSGAEARWNGETEGSVWIPHPDPEVIRGFLPASAEHERYRAALARPGTYSVRSQLLLPEAKVDLRLASSHEFAAEVDGRRVTAARDAAGEFAAEFRALASKGPLAFLVEGRTGPGFRLHASLRTDLDPNVKPLRPEHLLVPWAQPHRPPKPLSALAAPSPVLGDWARGRALFFGEAKCSLCHTMRGEGGRAAPDLSNLVHWETARIRKEILEPSATLNPDYVNHLVALRDGRRLSGVVLPDGPDRLRIVDTEAKEVVVARADIQELKPSSVSIMPDGFQALGEEKLADLLTFLTAPTARGAAPRRRSDVEALLAQAADTGPAPPRPLKVVLVTGPKDHGLGEHDYPAWVERWKALLGKSAEVRVSTAFKAPDRGQWELADLMVFYFMDGTFWSEERYKDLDAYLARGGGLVLLHSSVIPDKDPSRLAARIGLAWEPKKTKFRHGPLQLRIRDGSPITRGLKDFDLADESYWPLFGDRSGVEILATSREDGDDQPMAWTCRKGPGRVFGTLLGHYYASFDDPYARFLILRGMAWAAGEPVDRFKALVTDGVPLRE